MPFRQQLPPKLMNMTPTNPLRQPFVLRLRSGSVAIKAAEARLSARFGSLEYVLPIVVYAAFGLILIWLMNCSHPCFPIDF